LPAVAAPAPAVAPRSAVAKPEALDWAGMDWPAIAAVPGVAPAAPVASPVAPEVEVPAAAAPVPAWPGVQGALGAAPLAAPPALPPALLSPPDFAEPAPQPVQGEEGAEAEERAMQGTLEIDGALLGRFVAEHLAREAGRPASGMTGFDPLVSPQWAGALQG
jgi:hypothetical protein